MRPARQPQMTPDDLLRAEMEAAQRAHDEAMGREEEAAQELE